MIRILRAQFRLGIATITALLATLMVVTSAQSLIFADRMGATFSVETAAMRSPAAKLPVSLLVSHFRQQVVTIINRGTTVAANTLDALPQDNATGIQTNRLGEGLKKVNGT